MPFAVVGCAAMVPDVNAPVDAVVAPIDVLFIIVLTTPTDDPDESTVPSIVSLIMKSILFPARKTILVPALNSATPNPLTLNESPINLPYSKITSNCAIAV